MNKRKINVAVVTGGPYEEREISLKSAELVIESLTDERLRVFTIDIQAKLWREISLGIEVDKNDFSIFYNGEKIIFDIVYPMLHGSPAEDGKFQGYLDILGIPYTGCSAFVSALTFNKIVTKCFLQAYDVNVSRSLTLSYAPEEEVNMKVLPYDKIKKLGLPLFIKPNRAGSSYGVHKVKSLDELQEALEDARLYDNQILIEEFLDGREFSCGVIPDNPRPRALPITELIPDGEFFDFAAKYRGESKEVTPADLPSELEKKCRTLSVELYEILSCEGIVRFDYILSRNHFYFLEVNTIPGLTPTSIVPQEIRAEGLSEQKVLQNVLLAKLKLTSS